MPSSTSKNVCYVSSLTDSEDLEKAGANTTTNIAWCQIAALPITKNEDRSIAITFECEESGNFVQIVAGRLEIGLGAKMLR